MEAVHLNGDFIMLNSHRIQGNIRAVMAAGNRLRIKCRGAIVASSFVLALVVGLLTGSPAVLAQEQSSNVVPIVRSVNINTAGVATLAANLKGIGESRAMEIVRYRESYGPYGPFESIDELAEVKGIGQSTLDMNRSVITLE